MLDRRRPSTLAVTVKVVGGLGNQLFCFFAGRYIASLNHVPLLVDMSDIRSGRGVHKVTIEDFNLEADFIGESQSYIDNLRSRILSKIRRKGHLENSFNYFSNVIGFDPQLSNLLPPVTINGYFQSYLYFFNQKHSIKNITLKNPSTWYQSQEKIFSSQDIVAVHVRRGDYKTLKNTYGLLGLDYYKACMNYLRERGITYPVHVFSDDIIEAKKMLSQLLGEHVTWVEPPLESYPAESLLLMSKAKVNIIANSTYSWWAGALNTNNNLVLAPKSWFKNMLTPEYIYPPEWIQIESHWEE